MRLLLLLLTALATGLSLSAQTTMNKDSLLRALPIAKEDSGKVLLLINIGQQYEGTEPEIAKNYYRQARSLSKKINYKQGELKFVSNYGFVLNMQGRYDSSLVLNLQAVEIAKQLKNEEDLAKMLFNTGSSYRLKDEYEMAVTYYQRAYAIFEKINNQAYLAQADDILQVLYNAMRQFRKGATYGTRAVAITRKLKNPVQLGVALNNLGINYVGLKKLDSALLCFKEALAIAKQQEDENLESASYLNISDIHIKREQYELAKSGYDKALILSRKLQINDAEVNALYGISIYYFHANDNNKALSYADSAISIAKKYQFKDQRKELYAHLSNIAFAMQDKKLGLEYASQSTVLGDSILNENIQKATLDIEKKYETEKKETQIKLQQATIQQKNTLNYILIGSALGLLVISLLSYRNYRNRQKLQQQRISELETEKQLTATEAVLKGEEQERARLAKDLHDGLGGMLSGLKHSFGTMKGNLIMTPDNTLTFNRSMDMLDSSINEMRRVAHNMMPEALVKFGLDTALKDFCTDVNLSGALRVDYQSIGMENTTLDNTTAITIFRIVQELLNNTMKHAAAQTAIVQLAKTDGTITITVEDDGKGFDSKLLHQTAGIGWSNIRNRVDFLKGKIDVKSGADQGTSVLIEFKV